MRTLFIGTVEFSRKTLQEMIRLGADIAGVVTKERSVFNADYADLVPLCKEHSIPFHFTTSINSEETGQWIESIRPDYIFCYGWSQLIKRHILEIPRFGVIGYHPAQLPRNRGRHPLIWALVLGLKETASTFFFMDEGVDSGDILSQERVDITYDDDAGSLYHKVVNTALQQIEGFLPHLEKNEFKRIPQEHTEATYWRKRCKNDGLIDFRMSSRAIYNLVRALTRPYVGAHLIYGGKEIKVWKAAEVRFTDNSLEPGKIIKVEGRSILVKCYTDAVRLLEHEASSLPCEGEYIL
ncbi:MAG: formyltransferase family protein [Candidatus Eremiobacteraeota bacterium]|nr:formyltransferase family protein [Candidatus Eremiobacteraeota bacterium]